MRRVLFLTLLLAGLRLAQAQSYLFFTFDPPGATTTTVAGINNGGQIVGRFTDASGSHGFLRTDFGVLRGGVIYTNIDFPGASAGSTFANGINSAGQITGSYSEGSEPHAFLRDANWDFSTIDLPDLPLGRPVNFARAINDKGDVAGIGWSGAGVTAGFLRGADGTVTTIQFGTTAAPQGVNNNGTIAGYFVVGGSPGIRRGFLRTRDGMVTSVDVPGIEGNEVTGINNTGQLTGDFGGHGFVRNIDGSFATLDVPGAMATFPTGINDSGQVVGYYTAGSESHGFLATPSSGGGRALIRSTRGVMSAYFFGGFDAIASGSWIEIYGQNLSQTTRPWRASDFTGDQGPTSLDGVRVRVNGLPAYVSYVSPGQVNAQVPANIPEGDATVTVMNDQGSGTAYKITAKTLLPGLFAFSEFNIAREHYLAALFPDFTTYVLPPNFNPALPSRRAKVGDTIILYGIGFGPLVSPVPPGRIAPGASNLQAPVQISIGGVPAKVLYAGSAPGSAGLYQFNIVVPAGITSTIPSVTFTVDGVSGTQVLELALEL